MQQNGVGGEVMATEEGVRVRKEKEPSEAPSGRRALLSALRWPPQAAGLASTPVPVVI